MPCSDNSIMKLFKSYFNMYIPSMDAKAINKSKGLRIKTINSSTDKALLGKPDMKHTNDKVNVTLYLYDRRKLYYQERINILQEQTGINNKKEFTMYLNNIRKISRETGLSVESRVKASFKAIMLSKHVSILEQFVKNYCSGFLLRYMRKDISIISYSQSINLQQSKHDKQYLSPLASLLERIYNKEIIFNIVNLKRFYNSGSIFSEALITKLKNRNNKPTRVLKACLNKFTIPALDRSALYNETYKVATQTLGIKNLVLSERDTKSSTLHREGSVDVLDRSLLTHSSRTKRNILHRNNLIDIMASLKHKLTTGIRIEIAGRLTKRNTAARSMFKLRYKGNIRNADCATKNLSTVLLRGHAKSNLLYNQLNSKLRIGSFGLKT